MKVFELTINGEQDYVAAPNLFKALLYYFMQTEFDLDNFDDDDHMREVPASEWAGITFTIEDKGETNLEAYMQSVTEPEIICSTAYSH